MEVDFDDWVYLFFPDLDFHIGKELDGSHYPFAKRNKAIEENISKETTAEKSFEEALELVKEKMESKILPSIFFKKRNQQKRIWNYFILLLKILYMNT